ncbi:MAG: KH domain-containing protein [Acidimicrobiales bacterium]
MTSSEQYEPGDVNTVEPAGAGGGYEPGDINQVEGGHDAGGEDIANRADGGRPAAVLDYLARSLADEPEAVVVETEQRQGSVRLRLHVAPEDMGRVIGRRGRTAQAIRALVGVAGVRDGVQTSVDIADD